MPFHGWTAAVLDFYEGLEVDNSRAYWQSHRQCWSPLRVLELDVNCFQTGASQGTKDAGRMP